MQSDETTRDSSRDDSKRTDTVLVSHRAAGSGEKIYHTDADCPAVGDMRSPTWKERAVLTDDWSECRYCSGDFKTGGVPEGVDPGATREALLEDVDPDDLRAGGGDPLQATFREGSVERQATLDEPEGADDC
jgi:hypothetical protein